jgi:capsid portal protein
MTRPEWIDWLIVSNTGSKLRDDAPEDIRKLYEEYLRQHEEWEDDYEKPINLKLK